ncbi:MAG TPA: D-alanine--D-alanine ligase [Bacteroidales bacterium]|nr:D-alanine--D-alanine ligase [Bacteroidales bacterium]HBZ22278.1 D-alanine--D-alanine ligase [Bacteroidales bacterium]
MKIGLTFDLRSWYLDRGYSMEDTAEFDKQDTVDAIDGALKKMGFETEPIGNCFQLIDALSSGKRWDLVFNIAEGLYGDGRESVVPAILDQYKIPYVFSGPVIMGISLNKHLTRLIVSAAGVAVSPGMLISEMKDIERCNLVYPLFIKPVSEGTGKGITEKSLVHSESELREMVEYLLTRFNQPALVEEYLPGREFTVGVIGSGDDARAIGGMEIECKDNLPYSVEYKENYQVFCKYTPLPSEFSDECKAVALSVWKALGGVDAGRVDVKADRNGRICFMEVNPLAGLHPVHSDLPILSNMSGIHYQSLIEMIMHSAIKRYHLSV